MRKSEPNDVLERKQGRRGNKERVKIKSFEEIK